MNFPNYLQPDIDSTNSSFSANVFNSLNQCKHSKKVKTNEKFNCYKCGLYLPTKVNYL